jgi:pimeloyl-ACP methyl ester carboxylesterase
MDAIAHHGRETAYRVSDRGGSGPTICCVHGTGATSAVWKSQHRLSDEFPIVTLDCSGHGESEDVDTQPGFETLAAYADDVLAVVETTDADVLLGHSLGGAVVLHLLVERSVDVQRVILAGTGARLPVPEELRTSVGSNDPDAVGSIVEYLHEPGRLFADPDEDLLAVSGTALANCSQSVLRRDFETCHRFDVRDQLSSIDIPALAVVGRSDQLTPPWYHRQLARKLPDCAFATLDDAGHLAMLEQPAAFNHVLETFLGSE